LAQKRPGKQFLFKEGKHCITTANKHKKGFPCERAEKSVNYEPKAKMLLCFRFKLNSQISFERLKTVSSAKKVKTLEFLSKTGITFISVRKS